MNNAYEIINILERVKTMKVEDDANTLLNEAIKLLKPSVSEITYRGMKEGDFIYHHSTKFGTVPAKVLRVSRGGKHFLVSASDGNQYWVEVQHCELQSEWKKRNA